MDPFDLFTANDYTFLRLQGGMGGNKVLQEYGASGIFKERSGMSQVDNVESFNGSSSQNSVPSLHIHATEEFIADVGGEFTGHGIRVTKNGLTADYRITDWTEGFDFDEGTLKFYRLVLKRENLWETNDLPLT